MSGEDARRAFAREAWERTRSWSDGRGDSETLTEGLVSELQAAGVPLRSLGELGNVNLTYHASIPILLDHLQRPYPDNIIGGIVQALNSRIAGSQVHQFLVAFLRDKWRDLSAVTLFALGDAIVNTAPKGAIEVLLEIAADPKYGDARRRPVLRVARSRDTRARSVIANYLQEANPNNTWLATRALRLAKMWDYADWVRPHLNSSNEFYRAEARQFFRALEKATGKGLAG